MFGKKNNEKDSNLDQILQCTWINLSWIFRACWKIARLRFELPPLTKCVTFVKIWTRVFKKRLLWTTFYRVFRTWSWTLTSMSNPHWHLSLWVCPQSSEKTSEAYYILLKMWRVMIDFNLSVSILNQVCSGKFSKFSKKNDFFY